MQAQLHGAELASGVHEGITHLVCLVGDEAPSIPPAALLEAVSRQGGGAEAVAALKEGLAEHRVQLVTAGWVAVAGGVGVPWQCLLIRGILLGVSLLGVSLLGVSLLGVSLLGVSLLGVSLLGVSLEDVP